MHRSLVGFDDDSWPEEDLYESNFGEILGKADIPKTQNSNAHVLRNRKTANVSTPKKNNSRGTKKQDTPPPPPAAIQKNSDCVTRSDLESTPTSSNEEKKASKNNRKKRVVFEENTGSAAVAVATSDASASPSDDRKAAAASAREQRSKRRHAQQAPLPTTIARPNKKCKTSKEKEDVVRIPMLTGTLYLYRGAHRRAEFVRKV